MMGGGCCGPSGDRITLHKLDMPKTVNKRVHTNVYTRTTIGLDTVSSTQLSVVWSRQENCGRAADRHIGAPRTSAVYILRWSSVAQRACRRVAVHAPRRASHATTRQPCRSRHWSVDVHSPLVNDDWTDST